MTGLRRHAILAGLLLLAPAVPAQPAATLSPTPRGLVRTESRQPANGLTYYRFTAPADPRFASFRLLGDTYATRAEAEAALQRARQTPVPMRIEPVAARFRLVSEPLPTEELARLALSHWRYLGLSAGTVSYEGLDAPDASGPHCVSVLEIRPGAAQLRPARGLDEGVGLETVSSMAARMGALAGVNGGYFRTRGTYRGESEGAYFWRGNWLSDAPRSRSAVAMLSRDGQQRLIFGQLAVRLRLDTGKSPPLELNGANRPRGSDEIIVYTPDFHATTLTEAGGLEVVVRGGKVVLLREGGGSTPIPAGGYVISGAGRGAGLLRSALRRGMRVSPRTEWNAPDPETQAQFERASAIVGAGPRLLAAGRGVADAEPEAANTGFFHRRHPRTALGVREDGTMILVVVDGRQWRDGLGATIPELALWMQDLGCAEALNLDGGGSSTLVVGGQVVNHPSDETGERPVSDALLVVPAGGR